MRSGVKKIVPSHRNYSYNRTFGSVSPETFSASFNIDACFPIPDQDADGLPFGCTGYSVSNICQDEDKKQYIPRFSYDEALTIMGITPSSPDWEKVGCDITAALKGSIVYGVQELGEGPELALNHRRGAYFQVEQIDGQDYFDSVRSALMQGNRSVLLATPWYAAFAIPQNGIIKAPNSYDTSFASWHAHVVSGWETINGVVHLKDKSWQGVGYGQNGFCYFPREVINQLLSIDGSGAFTLAPFSGQNIQTVRLTILQTIASYLRMILALLK